MTVIGLIPITVVNDDQIAIAASPAGIGNGAAVGGVDGRAVAVVDVDGLVIGACAADTCIEAS